MSMLNAANSITGNLAQVLFDGQKQVTDMAMKQVQVAAQMQVAAQEQDVTMQAVAMMAGKGTKLDTVV